jgi:putative ABC transport system permease protein
MLHDLRYSARLLARRPGFTAVALLSLALGLGGASITFGLVDGLVLKPFAYPEPSRLVTIGVNFPKMGDSGEGRFIEALSPAEFTDIRGLKTLTRAQAFDLGNRHVSGGDQPERLFTALVLGDLFEPIGLRPALGRGFTPDELAPGGPRVAVISHRVWRSRFNADPNIVGRAIRVNGVSTTVVGVMPPELLIIGADMWLPLQASPSAWPRGARQFTILARIADGATLQQVNAELGALAARTTAAFGNEFKEYDGWRLTAAPWADALTRSLQPAAYLLLGAIAFVLLIVCVNLANLQLSQAMSRQREMAVRIALGAGRWRVARQLLVESLMLASAGCALGLLVADTGLRAAVSLLPAQLVALDPRVGFSERVMVVSIAAALLCAVIVGILPAIRAMRTDPFETLKDDAQRTTASASANRVRHGLIVAEIALAMILLAGAGLLVRTMIHLSRLQPGVDARNVLTMRLTLPAEKYKGPAIIPFFDRLVEEVRNIPGVRTAAVASQFPPGVTFTTTLRFDRPTAGAAAGDGTGGGGALTSDYTIASPGVFETLGIPLRAGRIFTEADTATAPGVAVVNESFARRYYPGGASPIGQRIAAADPQAPWLTIVGIVADTRGRGPMREPHAELFVPVRQMPQFWNQLFLIVRTDGEPRAMLPAIRSAIASIDRDQPAYAIQTLSEAFAASLFAQRTLMVLLLLFAALATTLAAIGIYAVMSYAVTMRTQEIGIRMALGAGAETVRAMVVRQVLWLVGLGVTFGLAGALALGRLTSSVLAGTSAADPIALGAVTLLLGAVALVAGYVPARRASRIDPIVALRTS